MPQNPGFRPADRDIENLISAAREHSLGFDFLMKGDLASVAAIFQVHAFTVEAARTQLVENPRRGETHGVSETDHRL